MGRWLGYGYLGEPMCGPGYGAVDRRFCEGGSGAVGSPGGLYRGEANESLAELGLGGARSAGNTILPMVGTKRFGGGTYWGEVVAEFLLGPPREYATSARCS